MKKRRAHAKQECINCGKPFRAKRPWQRYCTLRCGWEFRGDRRRERIRIALERMDEREKVLNG